MCGVAETLAVVSIATTALGTISSFQGQKAQASAAQQAAEYQARINENNAIIAQNNRTIAEHNIETAQRNAEAQRAQAAIIEKAAGEAEDIGKVKEIQALQAKKQLIGRQRAVLAANGVDVNEGSAVDIQVDTAGIGKLDELTIRSNAAREALGYRYQAYNARVAGENYIADAANFAIQAENAGREGASFTQQAYANRAAGQSAANAGNSAAFGTLLTGIGSVASKWYTFSKDGGFGNKEPKSSGVNPYLVGDTSPYNFKTGYM